MGLDRKMQVAKLVIISIQVAAQAFAYPDHTVYTNQCKPNPDSDTHDVQLVPPVKWTPGNETYGPATIDLTISIRDIPNVNDDKQVVVVIFFLHIKWKDERLARHCKFLIVSNRW